MTGIKLGIGIIDDASEMQVNAMIEPRHRNIPLSIDERHKLDRHKQDYENRTGDTGDWAKFLGVVILAGLAALGIHASARATRREPTVWKVSCPHCSTAFPIQIPNPPPWRVTQVTCPTCDTELAIDFARPASSLQNGHQSKGADVEDTAYRPYCHFCQQPLEFVHSAHRVDRRGVKYLRCPTCGNAAPYALPGIE